MDFELAAAIFTAWSPTLSDQQIAVDAVLDRPHLPSDVSFHNLIDVAGTDTSGGGENWKGCRLCCPDSQILMSSDDESS